MSLRFDAVVVGGGPAGAAAATFLSRAGWSIALVEKTGFPRPKVCGEFLSATNLALLDQLGMKQTFVGRAGPEIKRVGVFVGKTALVAPMPAGCDRDYRWGRALGRDVFDAWLLELAKEAGTQVWQPFVVTSIHRRDGGFVCGLKEKDGGKTQELKSTIVIAAHGSWGVGPELDIPPRRVPVRGSDLFAFKTHFANCSLPPDLMPVLGFPGGYGGMVTSDNQRVSLSCCIRRDQLQRLRSGNSSIPAVETVVNHIRRSCSEVDRVLAGATPCSPGLVIGPIRPGIRKSFQPGFFLTGNAAGEAHPIVAEGISMALQSSWLLCRRLIAAQGQSRTAIDLVHVGDEVEREWRREFGPRLRMAAFFARLASNPVASALSVRLLHRFPALLEWGARSSGKVRQIVPLAAAAN